jgi:hypothetical protein
MTGLAIRQYLYHPPSPVKNTDTRQGSYLVYGLLKNSSKAKKEHRLGCSFWPTLSIGHRGASNRPSNLLTCASVVYTPQSHISRPCHP